MQIDSKFHRIDLPLTFFTPNPAQPFGVKWSKFSQESRTAAELEMSSAIAAV